jgi:hypothetical protein
VESNIIHHRATSAHLDIFTKDCSTRQQHSTLFIERPYNTRAATFTISCILSRSLSFSSQHRHSLRRPLLHLLHHSIRSPRAPQFLSRRRLLITLTLTLSSHPTGVSPRAASRMAPPTWSLSPIPSQTLLHPAAGVLRLVPCYRCNTRLAATRTATTAARRCTRCGTRAEVPSRA